MTLTVTPLLAILLIVAAVAAVTWFGQEMLNVATRAALALMKRRERRRTRETL